MALFDLGTSVELTRDVVVPPGIAWDRCRELLGSYTELGFSVEFDDERAPSSLAARVSDRSGTSIEARVECADGESGSRLVIALRGRLHVGGMKGMLASERQVRAAAADSLKLLLP